MKSKPAREPIAFVYDCNGCNKLVVVQADAETLACPKCGSRDMVFVGNRYAKPVKQA